MASKPKAKVWDQREGCFTDGKGTQSRGKGPRTDQDTAQKRDNNNFREGPNEGRNAQGDRQQQRGNRHQQNRGNNRSQNQGQNDRDQNQGYQNNRGQNQGYQNNRGQNQGYQNNRGQNQGYQNNRGQDQGYQNNRGQDQGYQNNWGQDQGHQNNRGHDQGYQNNRGQDQGFQNNRGQNRGHQNYRSQNRGHQNYRGQNRGQGYQHTEEHNQRGNQFSEWDNQGGNYQGQGQQYGGQFQQPMNLNQQRGLLPEPHQQPYNSQPPYMQYPMPPGPIMYQPIPMQPVGYPCMPNQPLQYPPPLMNLPPHPSDNFNTSRDQGRQNSNRGQSGRRNNNMERSSSSLSIDSVGSHHDDRQGQELRNRNRGRGGHPQDRERGNMERSSSTMSVDSVGSQHNDRQESRNSNFRGRGRGARRSDRGRAQRGNGNMERSSSTMSIDSVGSEKHGQDFRDRPNRGRGGGHNVADMKNGRNNNPDNGARPKQFRNENVLHGDNRNRDRKQRGLGDRPGGERKFRNEHGNDGNMRKDGNPHVDNARRGGRRGRGRGRYFRGNGRPINNRNSSVSDNSDQQSVVTVSEESDNDRDQGNRHLKRGRGGFNIRGFVGRGNRGRLDFRGRGNISLRQRGSLRNLFGREFVGEHPEQNEMKREMFERFFRSASFRGRVPIRGFRSGRGRFFRGRWSGFVGNKKERKGEDSNSTAGNFESDDQMSVSSEVSYADSSITDSVSESGHEGKKYEICLDDIYTVKLHTLRNRVMRYKRKLADMRRKNEDKDEIKKYQDNVDKIRSAIQEREASEKKEMERKNVGTNKQKEEKERQHKTRSKPERVVLSSGESDTEIKLKDVRTKSKKMHGVTTSKGRVSFRPKTQKRVKEKRIPRMTTAELSDTDSEEDIKDNDTDKQEEIEDTPTEKIDKDIKKKRQRNRNRKKKKQEENEDKGNKEREKVLTDLLSELDKFSLREQCTEKQCSDGSSASKPRRSSLNESQGSMSQGNSMNDFKTTFQTHQQETRENDPKQTSSEKGRKGSELNENGPDVNEVFKFMVKTLEGKGTPEEVKRESGIFPIGCDEISWFRKLKRRFTLIERNGTVEVVMVSNRDAEYCLDYITNRSCSKVDCKRYHVCKNLLAGNCIYGDKCKFSHDFLDERNMIVSKRLGYNNVFSSEEICFILRVRYPHICNDWIDSGTCEEPYCIGLHLCPRYLLGKCLEGETCPLIHDKCSDHNKPIVDAYRMGNWVENLFRKMVFMMRQPDTEKHLTVVETNRHVTEIPENASGERHDSSRRNRHDSSRGDRHDSSALEQISQELEDSAVERAICDRHLIGRCRRQRCRFLHCQKPSPYLWQVKLFGTWINLKEFEEVEKAYCDNKEFSEEIRLLHNDMEFSVVIVFNPQIRAVAVVIGTQDGGIHTDARRLSTMSYKEGEDESDSFKTQWRWYWLDDHSKWNLFDQDAMQHTLEVKFLGKQRDFNYSRENYRFKYIIDFNAMTQRNIGTRKLRQISRRPVFVPLQDVKDKQFPTSLSAAHVVETPLPPSWVPWDLAHPFELVTIDENTPVYTRVSDDFFRTLDRGQIEVDSIFRMQNHKLWSLYCNQEKSMLANLKRLGKAEQIDKRYLFHGTDSLDAVRGISINNFDARVSGKNATVYGDGAYFARDAKYSHSYTKGPERFMFMVTVLIGDYTVGNKTYRRPPNKPGNDHELYDSCVNDMSNPSIFIVFDKNQYYPEYLIQYHKVFEEFSTEEIQMSSSRVRPAPVRTTGTVPGAIGGMNVSTSQPTVAPARRRAPSPPMTVFHPSPSSTGNTAYQSSGLSGQSSVLFASDFAMPSAHSARSPVKDPVSPKKKDDSSCSIQ